MLKLSDLYANVSLESIDFQFNSTLGKDLEIEIEKFRSLNHITQENLNNSKICQIVKDNTGIKLDLILAAGVDAWMYDIQLDKNNVIYGEREWLQKLIARIQLRNTDAHDLIDANGLVDGTVNISTGRVTGDFSKVPIRIGIGDAFLYKSSVFTVKETVSCILHEIGHMCVYFEMLGRLVRTNYILSAGVSKLMGASTKERRIVILDSIENAIGEKIDNKDKLAEIPRTEDAYRVIILSTAVEASKQQLHVNIYDARSYEQLADNYVARLGYAKPLATCLNKISKSVGDKAYRSPAMNTFMNVVQIAWSVIHVPYMLQSPMSMWLGLFCLILIGNPLATVYDPTKKRILKLQHQLNDALKDTTLPKEIKQSILVDHDEIDKILSTMYNNIGPYEYIYQTLLPWGRQQQKRININEELEALYSNPLFTAAARIEVSTTV